MRWSWDEYFINLAVGASERSTCPRLSVGCVLVKDNDVISTGYNGSLPGEPHCSDIGCDDATGRCLRTIHAERNAIERASLRQRGGATLYCTHVPCGNCRSLIINRGIAEVVYLHDYKNYGRDIDSYHQNGIVVRKFNADV